MPHTNTATLRQKVERIARSPLANIDSTIRSLDPGYDSHGVQQAHQAEAALATIVGESEEAPIPSNPRDAAARRIQSAWRRARKRSRSAELISELLANLVAMEIIGHRGGKALIESHAHERAAHINSLGTMLTILAEHGKFTKASNVAQLIEVLSDFSVPTKHTLLPNITPNQRRALCRAVVYLSNSARASYRVGFEHGQLIWRGEPFHTEKMKSHWSPMGRAIYVMDKNGRFYAAEQLIPDRWSGDERFHHSSFLSGAPVMGAGEMQVNRGKLEVLTAQSGHYRPTHKEMLQTVRQLSQNNVRFYRIAMWAKDWRSALDLRQRFYQAQLDDTKIEPDLEGSYKARTEAREEDAFPPGSLQAPETSKQLAVYIPAQEYLWNPAMQSLLLYDPTHPDMK